MTLENSETPALQSGTIGIIFSQHEYYLWPTASLLRGGRVKSWGWDDVRIQNRLDYVDTTDISLYKVLGYLTEHDKVDSLDLGGKGDFVGIYPKEEAMENIGKLGLPLYASYGFVKSIDKEKVTLTDTAYRKNSLFSSTTFQYQADHLKQFYDTRIIVPKKEIDQFLEDMLAQ